MDEFGGKKDFLCDLYGMKGSRRVASWFSTGVMVSIAVFLATRIDLKVLQKRMGFKN